MAPEAEQKALPCALLLMDWNGIGLILNVSSLPSLGKHDCGMSLVVHAATKINLLAQRHNG